MARREDGRTQVGCLRTRVHFKLDEGIELYANSVVPAARAQAGNQGAWLLVDRSTGKGIALTVWDSEADMLAGESSGYYQEQVGKFAPLMVAPPVRDAYEVAVQE